MTLDKDALIAAVDVIGRTGARAFETGYLHDNVPVDQAGWWAKAQWRGIVIIEEDHRGPIEAAEALARRLLTNGVCIHCKKVVTLSNGTLGCRWTRHKDRWVRGCEDSG